MEPPSASRHAVRDYRPGRIGAYAGQRYARAAIDGLRDVVIGDRREAGLRVVFGSRQVARVRAGRGRLFTTDSTDTTDGKESDSEI